MAKIVDRVVVFTQENHTTDNYFTSLRAWGANVATGWPAQPNPPAHDQAHTRAAYAQWLHAHADGNPTAGARGRTTRLVEDHVQVRPGPIGWPRAAVQEAAPCSARTVARCGRSTRVTAAMTCRSSTSRPAGCVRSFPQDRPGGELPGPAGPAGPLR